MAAISNPIQYNNNMNPNPESGIRNPESESEFERREILSLLNSIQSNAMQSNCSCPNDIRSSCVDARERIYRLFGKSGQGKRWQIVRAVFLFGGQRERGREKLPHALSMQGKGYRLLPWGGRGRKEHRERHKKREKQDKNDDMLLTGDGRRRFCRDLWKSRTEPFIAASGRQYRAFWSEYGDVLRTACG